MSIISEAAMIRAFHDEALVSGEVPFDLDDLLAHDDEWFMDTASELLIGSQLLEDLRYFPVRVKGKQIIIYVEGDADTHCVNEGWVEAKEGVFE